MSFERGLLMLLKVQLRDLKKKSAEILFRQEETTHPQDSVSC